MRKLIGVLIFCLCLPLAFVMISAAGKGAFPVWAFAEEILNLDDMVVTGTDAERPLRNVTSTMQIFTREQIRQSPASSVTEFLAEEGVAFFSQWAPGQTSISMRGVRSDGQGRDFKGGVLVLINGRRAGTANLSKLSTYQVYRIEIIRGPASVSYGSQAMGGVINLITKNGVNTRGGKVLAQGGSFYGVKATAEYGGNLKDSLQGYIGLNGETRDDIEGGSGSGTQVNTAYKRYGGLGAITWEGADNGVDVTVRTDGVYDSGFRGSSYDIDNNEDRYNQSVDLQHRIDLPGLNAVLDSHAYVFRDVDDFRWGSEAAGYDIDNINRNQTGYGLKINPQFSLTDTTNFVPGLDFEYSQLRSDRYRHGVDGPKSQTAPYDMNQNSLVLAGYAEVNQSLLSDRMNLQAGLRYTHNDLSLVDTPYVTIKGDRDVNHSHVTYNAGLGYNVIETVKLRTSFATGFRAPTGSELAGEYTPVLSPNRTTMGNPNLDPETNRQFEVGVTYSLENAFLDLALFDNTIQDRIKKKLIMKDGKNRIYQYENSSGDANIQGAELIAQCNFASLFEMNSQKLTLLLNGAYNFKMEEKGTDSNDSGPYADKVQRVPVYQGSATLTYGWRPWDVSLISTLNGPMYYDTEEKLTPAAQDAPDYVHRKGSFAVFSLRGNYYPMENVRIFGGINNLFDKNYHPMFIQIDDGTCLVDPTKTNGGCGNSLAGRNFYIGLEVSF